MSQEEPLLQWYCNITASSPAILDSLSESRVSVSLIIIGRDMFNIPNEVTIKKLQYFLVAAEELHFSRASEILGIAQPSLSAHIRELEQVLDIALFNRTSRLVVLTLAGEMLKRECYKVLSQIDSSINKVVQTGRLAHNTINIGVISAALTNDFMLIIDKFKKRSPNYHVNFIELPPAEQKFALLNNEIDVGICRFADTINIQPLSAISIVKESMHLAVSVNHHFSSRKRISIAELKGERFVIMNRKRSASANYVINCMLQEGFSPIINNEVIEPSTLLAFISSSQLVSIVPESFANIKFCNIKMIPIKENIPSDICAMFNNRVNPQILDELISLMNDSKK